LLTGDYTDRGPDGFAIIEMLYDLKQQGITAGSNIIILMGNHELMQFRKYSS
jgi:hypothetical protein